MKLTSENVEKIFRNALFTEDEDTTNHVIGEGFRGKVGFHPQRLEERKEDIISMLSELPDSFRKTGGGGMSFMNACFDRDGNLWTGFHPTMDELFALGSAIGKSKFVLPREMWPALPGGMPYIVVDL